MNYKILVDKINRTNKWTYLMTYLDFNVVLFRFFRYFIPRNFVAQSLKTIGHIKEVISKIEK